MVTVSRKSCPSLPPSHPLSPPSSLPPLQVKMAKPHLKQLQQCVKTLSAEDESSPPSASPPTRLTAESFEWLNHEQTYAIVYLVRRERGRERERERRREGGGGGGREERREGAIMRGQDSLVNVCSLLAGEHGALSAGWLHGEGSLLR